MSKVVNIRLSKRERLKSRKIIEKMFSDGKSLFVFPLKLIVLPIELINEDGHPFIFGVTVPKRIHKKAHQRNLLKRRIREAYRLNKPSLSGQTHSNKRYALMYILIDKNISDYGLLEQSVKRLNLKLDKYISSND